MAEISKEDMKRILKEYAAFENFARRQLEDKIIMFADMAGSTQYKYDMDHIKGLYKVILHNEEITDVVEKSGGRVLKYIGDEVMACFDDVANSYMAINAAIIIQEKFTEMNRSKPEVDKILCKIGMDQGEVISMLNGSDLHGTHVDIAARLVAMAKPQQILVTKRITDGANLLNVSSKWLKFEKIQPTDLVSKPVERLLKGIRKPIDVCEIRWMAKFLNFKDEGQLAYEWKLAHKHLGTLVDALSGERNLLEAYLGKDEGATTLDRTHAKTSWRTLRSLEGKPYKKLLDFWSPTQELQYNVTAVQRMRDVQERYASVAVALESGVNWGRVLEVFDEFEIQVKNFMTSADAALEQILRHGRGQPSAPDVEV